MASLADFLNSFTKERFKEVIEQLIKDRGQLSATTTFGRRMLMVSRARTTRLAMSSHGIADASGENTAPRYERRDKT